MRVCVSARIRPYWDFKNPSPFFNTDVILAMQRIHIIIGVIIALLLACILAFPFGPDHSIFAVGGELIYKKNALPYKDFLESKPPLIFYIYGFAMWLFGHHEC